MASSDLSQTLEGASKDFAEGRYSEAYSAFLLALPEVDASSDPVAAGAIHTNCGACLLGLGKVEEALEEYNRALELDSTNTNALHNKGAAGLAVSSALADAEVAGSRFGWSRLHTHRAHFPTKQVSLAPALDNLRRQWSVSSRSLKPMAASCRPTAGWCQRA